MQFIDKYKPEEAQKFEREDLVKKLLKHSLKMVY